MYLYVGPRTVLQCFEGATTEPFSWRDIGDDGPYTGFLTTPLQKILDDRKVEDDRIGGAFHQIILDRINNPEGDKCEFPGHLAVIAAS